MLVLRTGFKVEIEIVGVAFVKGEAEIGVGVEIEGVDRCDGRRSLLRWARDGVVLF